MKHNYKKIFTALAFPFIGLIILTLVIMAERQGLQYNLEVNVNKADVFADGSNVAWEDIAYSAPVAQSAAECIVIADTAHEYGQDYLDVAAFSLDEMQVAYDLVDLKDTAFPDLSAYKTCVLVISDLSVIGDEILDIFNWVRQGGHLTNTGVFDTNVTFQVVASKLGIVDGGAEFCVINGFRVKNNFMLGGTENDQTKTFVFNEPMPAALAVNLVPECEVYLESDTGVPLLWGVDYGKGKMVINNFSIIEKAARGIFAAAYSALDDVSIYPVINASCFFLDDFPSPVPMGENEYIAADYGCDVNTFYTNIWWPDVLAWEKE
ncbi:MAG: DUF2194 domain-containing protein, partial [Oscillospiraceae bacterium]|nr:DUF2194 domain-containing protein [Oscillospiraceae bacterium]